jgi:hypothetical protein
MLSSLLAKLGFFLRRIAELLVLERDGRLPELTDDNNTLSPPGLGDGNKFAATLFSPLSFTEGNPCVMGVRIPGLRPKQFLHTREPASSSICGNFAV